MKIIILHVIDILYIHQIEYTFLRIDDMLLIAFADPL
jgi:hypothetical protein